MNILLKYPSRGRPSIFKKQLQHYIKSLSGKHSYKFIFTFDSDDISMNNDDIRSFIESLDVKCEYYYGEHINKIAAINDNMENQIFDFFILLADDIYVSPNFDEQLAQIFNTSKWALDSSVFIHTVSWYRYLDVFCVMGYEYYKRFNYIYYPGYISEAADKEYTEVSKLLNRSVEVSTPLLEHRWDSIETDSTRERNMDISLLKRDEELYDIRLSNLFDIKKDVEDTLIQLVSPDFTVREGIDINKWSRVHPRFEERTGCIVDLGCLGLNSDVDNWCKHFIGKKRVIGADPRENNFNQVELFNGAVSNFTGRGRLVGTCISATVLRDAEGDVNVITWKDFKDKFNIHEISILKINIEGAEVELINSFQYEDFENIDQIAISFHDWLIPELQNDVKTCIDKITDHRYHMIDLGIYGWKLFLKNDLKN